MKKTISRALSLLLVLVMVLGILPVASADTASPAPTLTADKASYTAGEIVTVTLTPPPGYSLSNISANPATSFTPKGDGTFTATYVASDSQATWDLSASCTLIPAAGGAEVSATSNVVTVGVKPVATGISLPATATVGVGGTVTLNLAATPAGADLPEGTVTWTSQPESVASVVGGVVTGVAEGTATITATLAGKTASTTVTVTKAEMKLTGTTTAITMKVGETGKAVSATVTPTGAPGVVTYTSSDDTVVAVNSATGALTAKKEGSAIVKATLTKNTTADNADDYVLGTPVELSWTVTVEDGAVINCADTSKTAGSTIVLTPTLSLNNVTVTGATFTALASSGLTVTSTDNKTFYVTRSGAGYGTVTFTANAFQGTDGQPYEDTVTKVVNVSFYNHNSITVNMADGIGTLDFDDASDLKFSLFETKSTLAGKMLNGVANVNNNNKVYFTTNLSNSLAQLNVIAAGGASNWVLQGGLGSVDLVLKTSSGGSYTFTYKICENGNDALIYGTGDVTVNFGKGESITYSTTTGKKVTFKETDFATFWTKAGKTAVTMDYVMFGVSTTIPSQGELYNNASYNTAAYETRNTDKYAITPGTGELDLGGVTYMASTYNTAPHIVEIPFTIVGTTATQTVSGTVQIKVNHTDGNIYSRGVVLGATGYDYDDLIANTYKTETGLDLYYVEFTIPSANYGRLYTSIPSVGGYSRVAEAKPLDRYEPAYATYQNGRAWLPNVAFVPAAGFTGKVVLSYTAYDVNKTTPKAGTLELNVLSRNASQVFTDVTTKSYSWASDSVDFLYYEGTAQGSNGKYNPSANITRRDFMLMLYRAFLAEDYSSFTVTSNFPDVVKGADSYSQEIYQAVGVAKYLGIAQGTNNKFNPTSNITRQEAMVLIYRTMEVINKDLEYSSTVKASSFKDYSQISSWATTAIANLVSHGVIQGTNDYIKPTANITRAEMACILHRVLTY